MASRFACLASLRHTWPVREPYNTAVNAKSDPARRWLLLPGALLPRRWLAGELLHDQLPHIRRALARGELLLREQPLPTLARPPAAVMPAGVPPVSQPGLLAIPAGMVPAGEPMHEDWAHDRWLRAQPPLAGLNLPAGAMAAIRRLAQLPRTPALGHPGWLMQPVRFSLTTDRMLLDARAGQQVDAGLATRLVQAIAPLLADAGYRIGMLTPSLWLLQQLPGHPGWQLHCSPIEAVGEQHVDTLLPRGADARLFRRLLNEIQMTWYQLNLDAEHDLPVNGVWLSGPVTPAALQGCLTLQAQGLVLDESLLPARLDFDLNGWLAALPMLDRHHQQDPAGFACLLCGQYGARWLHAPAAQLPGQLPSGPSAPPAGPATAARAGWAQRLRGWLGLNRPRDIPETTDGALLDAVFADEDGDDSAAAPRPPRQTPAPA